MKKEIPDFQEGAILRAKTLQNLCDYTYLLPQLIRKGYTDGIVSGMEVTENQGEISVDTGVFSYQGKLFCIETPITVDSFPTTSEVALKLRCISENKIKNGTEFQFELVIEDVTENKNDFELCRFRLQDGAKLRHKYVDFQDISTEYDTINLQYAQFSGFSHVTLHPNLLRLFAEEMLEIPSLSEMDASFCLQILSKREPLEILAIKAYLQMKTGEKHKESSISQVYEGLLSLLSIAKEEKPQVNKKKEKTKATILID